ncbi:dipeptide/oligopeptide/nickel ABC transporter ATP-binding protein [Streptomyces spiroverticillatus]|uniref:Dipeptide/oligopeptide/nickel ABC transporter ATP-binding protein n=1 Tax=Streptomyces finlayi TaxID=67296 RepID=A0A918WZE3_9ACTN|nr:dipeptide/oligopeptide/nickel ABC transporter ATP-binding protein [Streptomyces spiroverticillatus]GHC96770.1 dipeptide/oligopeptide/nickel ABC transporter ATP-binding protein [Streptomyces finlayi]
MPERYEDELLSEEPLSDELLSDELLSGELLSVEGLSVDYFDRAEPVHAVRDVRLGVRRGETLGVVGESGCGKSTLVTALTRLERPPAVITAGSALYRPREGEPVDLLRADERQLSALRWRHLAIVFQSAMNALNPVHRLGAQFVDVLRAQRGLSKKEAQERAGELLGLVGIPADRLRAYPHELSGGMRQRATIALALACEPELVVMDEPTTAVDVVMQRQILKQIGKLQAEFGFSVVFVTHDLSLLIEIADRIAVMYAGRVVEVGPARQLYENPAHPYTAALRNAFPPLRGPRRPLTGIPGSPPGLRHPPAGCAFHPRCASRFAPCDTEEPELLPAGAGEAACHLPTHADAPRTEEAPDATD